MKFGFIMVCWVYSFSFNCWSFLELNSYLQNLCLGRSHEIVITRIFIETFCVEIFMIFRRDIWIFIDIDIKFCYLDVFKFRSWLLISWLEWVSVWCLFKGGFAIELRDLFVCTFMGYSWIIDSLWVKMAISRVPSKIQS